MSARRRRPGRPRLWAPGRTPAPPANARLTDVHGNVWLPAKVYRVPAGGREWRLQGVDYYLKWDSPAMAQFGPFVVS